MIDGCVLDAIGGLESRVLTKMAARAASVAKRVGYVGLGLAAAGAFVDQCLYNVWGGERAVIFDRLRQKVLPVASGEGTHFIIPFFQKANIFSIRSTPRSIPVVTGSKDLQTVDITLRILFRPDEAELPRIFKQYGMKYDDQILPSITTEVLKAVVAQFDAGELITQREVVSQRVSDMLTDRATFFGMILDDIAITHLAFGREFTDAVERKQVAQQEAERARFLVEKAEQVKQAAIVSSEGDSIAAEQLGRAFTEAGEGLIELRRLEAAEDIAGLLSRSRNVAYLPGSGQNMLLNIKP